MRRILAADTLQPWQYRSWLFIRDPDFAAKATRVLDLYARIWDGRPLSEQEYVISSDEKTAIQARCRCHPTLPPGASRMMRVEHEYDRGGALAYLAAYDVHRAHVIGLCSDTTGIDPFMELVDEVMTQEPYASAKRVFWIVDNGSSHRGQAAIDGSPPSKGLWMPGTDIPVVSTERLAWDQPDIVLLVFADPLTEVRAGAPPR